jgi:hypothetical protein
MAYPDKDLAAGGQVVGSYAPLPLFAGDADVVTEEEVVVTGQVLAKLTVVGKVTATGKLTVYTPGAVDGSEKAYGVLTQAADGTLADVNVAAYTAGFFNHDALVWPAAIDTLAERKAAFAGTQIRIGSVRL